MKKIAETATMPTPRDQTWPTCTLISPSRTMGVMLERLSGNATGRPSLKEWESTSVMIIPIPMERTMVALMSTSPLLDMTFWNRGAEARFRTMEEATPAAIPRTRLFPVSWSTLHVMYMENTTTWG